MNEWDHISFPLCQTIFILEEVDASELQEPEKCPICGSGLSFYWCKRLNFLSVTIKTDGECDVLLKETCTNCWRTYWLFFMLLLYFLSMPINILDEKYPNNPKSPMQSPSTMTSTGFVLRPTTDSRWWCWPSRPSPIYLTLVKPHAPVWALRSTTSAGRLVPPSLRANKGRSGKSWLSALAPQCWTNVRTAGSLAIFCKRLKTHLFRIHLNPA